MLNTDYFGQKTYEQLRTCALNTLSLAADDEAEDFTQDYRDYQMNRAQVYATLALAAATHEAKRHATPRRENVFEFADRIAKEATELRDTATPDSEGY